LSGRPKIACDKERATDQRKQDEDEAEAKHLQHHALFLLCSKRWYCVDD
jgi:hypothetical protein